MAIAASARPVAPRTRIGARRRAWWPAPLGLLVVHVLVQLRVRPYPKWNDALLVMDFARRFPDLPDHWRFEPVAVAQHSLRIGMILPARAFQGIFGYGQVAFYAWPFLTGVMLVLATYWLGELLFSRPAAIPAALVVI